MIRSRSPGERFGWLTLIEPGPLLVEKQAKVRTWIAQCDCGNRTTVRQGNLGRHTRSCGCWRIELAKEASRLRDGKFNCGVAHSV